MVGKSAREAREDRAIDLWANARTPELRTLLRERYPGLFTNPPPLEPWRPETRAADPERVAKANALRAQIKSKWPDEFGDGALCAFTQHFSGERERGGYPKGFHGWPIDRKNAWYSGYSFGRNQRLSGGQL